MTNQTLDRDRASDENTGDAAEAADRNSDLPDALWVIPVALVSLMAGLLTQARGIHSASLGIAFISTGVVAGVATATALVLYFLLFRKNIRRTLAVTAALIFVCFTWIYWTIIGGVLAEPLGIAAAGDIATVLIPAVIVWAAAHYGERDWFAIVATGLAFAIVLLMATVVVPRLVRAPNPPVAVAEGTAHPNTVLLILDGYARSDSLADDYGA